MTTWDDNMTTGATWDGGKAGRPGTNPGWLLSGGMTLATQPNHSEFLYVKL